MYYRDKKPVVASRDYREVPHFSPAAMNDDLDLQAYSNTIESALCLWDRSMNDTLTDDAALRVLECLIDKYHFKEDQADTLEEPIRSGYEIVLSAIRQDHRGISAQLLVKVLGAVYFVARRRAKGGRDYFEVIHRYVGTRVGSGIRALDV